MCHIEDEPFILFFFSDKDPGLPPSLDQELNENIRRVLHQGELADLPQHPPTAVRILLLSQPAGMYVLDGWWTYIYVRCTSTATVVHAYGTAV